MQEFLGVLNLSYKKENKEHDSLKYESDCPKLNMKYIGQTDFKCCKGSQPHLTKLKAQRQEHK